jgi:hypothetical protein
MPASVPTARLSDPKETVMSPDAHLFIHRAEQAARARAHAHHASDATRSPRRLSARLWRPIGTHGDRARGRPRPIPGRGVLWRRT